MFELCRYRVANLTSCSSSRRVIPSRKNRIEFQWGSKLPGTSSMGVIMQLDCHHAHLLNIHDYANVPWSLQNYPPFPWPLTVTTGSGHHEKSPTSKKFENIIDFIHKGTTFFFSTSKDKKKGACFTVLYVFLNKTILSHTRCMLTKFL